MPINAAHKQGVRDLLIEEEQNVSVLYQLAKNVTKSVCELTSKEEALEYLCTYVENTYTLLNKRHLTREMLFKYLQKRIPNISTDFSKSDLINNIIKYWDKSFQQMSTAEEASEPQVIATNIKQFPITKFAHKFTEWFFNNYNQNNLKNADFWSDAQLILRTVTGDGINDDYTKSADDAVKMLIKPKLQFGLYFNPNLTDEGVQGRMDPHGLVLVLTCGTIHTQNASVGVFECVFGLLRDPFAENNWKIKRLKFQMRNEISAQLPRLQYSETLQEALSLPVTDEDLT